MNAAMEWMRQTEAECLKAATASAPALAPRGSLTGADESPEYAADQYQHFRSWAHASIRAIAQKIAEQPLVVARRNSRRAKPGRRLNVPKWLKHTNTDNLEPLDAHPLLDVIDSPNPIMTRWHLLYVTVVSLEVTGRAFWWVREQDGRKNLWPLPPHWVTPKHEGKYFSSWRVKPSPMSEGITVAGPDIVYFNYPDFTDLTGSYGPLQANARAVSADGSILDSMTAAMRNGLYPGLAFTIGDDDDEGDLSGDTRGSLTGDQRNEILAGLKRYYRSPGRHSEPLLLDSLVRDVKQISTKPREMDFMETGDAIKDRVTQGFGVNPIVLGHIEGANRASSIAARKHFVDFTVNPKIQLIGQTLNARLRPHFEPTPEANTLVSWLEPCVVEDPEQKLADDEFMLSAGATDVAELRARRNMPPRPDLEGKR